jgi:hypothetical protein
LILKKVIDVLNKIQKIKDKKIKILITNFIGLKITTIKFYLMRQNYLMIGISQKN